MITTLSSISKLFDNGNVMVYGPRGSGKDLLFGNVIAYRKKDYISNCDYKCNSKYIPLDFNKLNCGYNNYKNIISGQCNKYIYPYPDGVDIYISDCGIIFPSHYNTELDKNYPYLPTFFALSRHLGECSIHCNTQSLDRVYLKLREQNHDTFIRCRGVNKFILQKFGWVVMDITIYDKYDSAVNNVKPCRINVPLLASSEAKMSAQLYLDKFFNTHGNVHNYTLIFKNRCSYDSRFYKKLFEGGV